MKFAHFLAIWISLSIIILLAIAGGTPAMIVTASPGIAGIVVGTLVAVATLRMLRT